MNKTIQAALAATLMIGLAHGARADLDLNGEVGLPLNPTAQVPNKGGVRVQGNYYDMNVSGGGGNFKLYGLEGAGAIANNLELNGGISKLKAPNGSGLDRSGLDIGAKYLITHETDPAGVRIAVGAGYSRALLNNVRGYVVASKYLGTVTADRVPITGHLGLRYDRFTIPNGGGRSNKASVYVGAEVPLTREGNFQFIGELQSKNNKFGNAKVPFSAGIRFRPAGKGFSATLGVQRQGLINTSGKFFAQLGYTFDTSGGTADSTMTTTTTSP